MLYFARYFQQADGRRVVALAEVPLSVLVAVMAQGVDIEGLEVTLEHEGGALLVSVPHRSVLNVPQRPLPLVQSALVQPPGPLLWSRPARLSQRPGMVVVRPILYRDLWLPPRPGHERNAGHLSTVVSSQYSRWPTPIASNSTSASPLARVLKPRRRCHARTASAATSPTPASTAHTTQTRPR